MAKKERRNSVLTSVLLPPRLVANLADQVAKIVSERIATLLERRKKAHKAASRSAGKKFVSALFLDTSAIIDGRILEVAKLGFLTGDVVIPEFVLSELKYIADSEETLRRNKGRRGLDVISDFKKVKGVKLSIFSEDEQGGGNDIDERLLRLTRFYRGRLATSDFNLNKKAKILGINVLNVNELANVLKTVALPGEGFRVTIVAEGKGKGQGVGYLSDGTMIVVEEGAPFIGKTLDVIVSRTIQTAAGRMFFTKLKEH